ncbi:hypothetical protein [Lacimonas salitolerans]|uniref:MxaK protein n=1 Tax=Lacimonas salitolerans TaxID=1323750 RepID=A0ABW4EGA0_9RHOB
MERFLITTSTVAILLVGGGSVLTLAANAPAFNAELRRGNVFDQPILAVGADMYDRASYLMQQAASYIRADLLPYADDPDRLTAPVEVVAERGSQAVALMDESLSLNPGNAHAWAVMASARIYSGDIEGARDALRTSWELAPHNFSLAPERLDLALVLFDPLTDDVDDILTDADRAAMRRDLDTVIRHHRAEDVGFYREELELSGLDLELPQE